MVLRFRPRPHAVPVRRRLIFKWLGLWSPLRWPHGWRTNPHQDPRINGTRPSRFEKDRQRALLGLRGIAAAHDASVEQAHGVFGKMSVADWQRWAYKHTDHHLRQFGL